MEKVSLPRSTQKERHNDNCFKDFKNYLDRYIANEDEKKYQDYYIQATNYSTNIDADSGKPIPIDKSKEVSHQDFLSYVAEQYSSNLEHHKIVSKEDFLQKIKQTLFGFSEKEQNILRGIMIQTDFNRIVESILSSTVEELIQNCKTSVFEKVDR